MQRLKEGEIEGAIVALESDIGDADHVAIGVDPFVFAAPPGHPLSRTKRRISPKDLDGQSLLLLDDGHCFGDQALAFCSKAGADELAVRATSLPTLAQIAVSGAGVTLLPSLSVAVENRRGSLHIRRFAGDAPKRTIVLVWRRGSAFEPTLRTLATTMKNVYRDCKG